ncbi:translation initiation factor IF-3, C-terminal domain-containing protein [Radiomyces spectabilis]|uniref:translation initiation factor IF-3, C-terminal domain-containing protein n=1 Tax=Radiomyces spectabilis TaxID=64574 RepID=UPI00221E645A|nr:translation initiation factor IF-3, C-terminal domain-containing protein [Radiomyces spectabilis]KAI8371704.1 translation initiation factor IF-3, C-terminal domain-containing protein [Radiomyces spectabilis]
MWRSLARPVCNCSSLLVRSYNTKVKTKPLPSFRLPSSRSTFAPLGVKSVGRPGPPPTQAQTQSSGSGSAPAPKDRARRDEEITAAYITFVDENGELHRNVRLENALQQFDRSRYFLIEVDPTARHPVCRLFDKKALFEKAKQSKKKKTTTPESVVKEIVFGWNVSPHDMGHKLNKARQFLDKGNKVKVEIVSKKGQASVTRSDQQETMAKVVAEMEEYKLSKPPKLAGSSCFMQFERK